MMFSIYLIFIIFSIGLVRSTRILHGFYSNSNRSEILYGQLDLDQNEFTRINSLNIDDIGDPNQLETSPFPCVYDPNNDVIYIASMNDQNETIFSIIDASNGNQILKSKFIKEKIHSLQYDVFRKILFGHIQFNETHSAIIQINLQNGTIQQVLHEFLHYQLTSLSSYSSISGLYFLIFIEDNQFISISFNTSDSTNSLRTKLDFLPVNMRYDYIESRMYMIYRDIPDDFICSIGIFNENQGEISEYIGTISWSSSLIIHSISTYDIRNEIYYISSDIHGTNSTGIISIDINKSNIEWNRIPMKSNGFFVRQCAF